jgi:lysophospholipase L1-like esterase
VLGTTVGGNPLAINGLTVPLSDQYVLLPSEQSEINARTTAFNSIIAATVAGSGGRLALADVNTAFTSFATAGATVVGGVTLTASIAPPYAGFSEDGVHPNGRGYGFMANIFIKAINSTFGATIPEVDISQYKGTQIPLFPL